MVAAILISGALNVVLGLQVRTLNPQASELKRMRAFPFVSQWVPTVKVSTLGGDSVTIGEAASGGTQTLIVFTASCQYCRETLPVWKQITSEIRSKSNGRNEVFWVSLSSRDSTAAYVAAHGITGPVVFPPDKKMMRVYRVKGVPMTVVLDHRGRVLHAHPSVFRDAAAVDSVLVAATSPEKIMPRAVPPAEAASK
jgi:peroxiredoxin